MLKTITKLSDVPTANSERFVPVGALLCRGLVGTVALLAVLAASRNADACSAPIPKVITSPRVGASVPANVKAIAIARQPSGVPYAGLMLAGPTGAVVPTTATMVEAWTTLTPSVPFSEGCDYSFRYQTSGPNPTQEVLPFHVAAAAPAPSSLGTLAVVERTTRAGLDASSACWTWVPADGVRLAIEPSSSLAPYLAVVQWRVRVDGLAWRTSSYGHCRDETRPQQYFGPDPTPLHVFTQCTPSSVGADRGVPPGHHVIEVTAAMVGEELSLAPMTIEVDLACPGGDAGAPTAPTTSEAQSDGPPPPVAIDFDAGRTLICAPAQIEDAGAPGSVDASPDSGSPDGGLVGSGAQAGAADDGCSMSRGRPDPLGPIVGGFALIGAALLIRRRAHGI